MSNWKILYIDDSQTELSSVATALNGAGYEVITRPGPYDLEEPLASADLVIIDYHLSGTNGRETLELLRDMLGTRRKLPPRFYLYTSDKEVGADYSSLGFDGRFIRKGNTDALRRQLDATMRIEELRRLRASKR